MAGSMPASGPMARRGSAPEPAPGGRVVYNASKAYVMQLHGADAYPVLCDGVGVTICNFNLWPEQDERGRSRCRC
jgi:hypothetical protein